MKHVHLSRGKPTLISSLKVPTTLLSHPPTGNIGMVVSGQCAYRYTASVVTAHNNEKPASFFKTSSGKNSTIHLIIILVLKCKTYDRSA